MHQCPQSVRVRSHHQCAPRQRNVQSHLVLSEDLLEEIGHDLVGVWVCTCSEECYSTRVLYVESALKGHVLFTTIASFYNAERLNNEDFVALPPKIICTACTYMEYSRKAVCLVVRPCSHTLALLFTVVVPVCSTLGRLWRAKVLINNNRVLKNPDSIVLQ